MRKLLMLMFRIGIIGFGGGSALIPIIEKEAVQNAKLISKEEYEKFVVVSSITPGALPVELSAGIGWLRAGRRGLVAAAAAMAAPGAIITFFAIMLLAFVNEDVLRIVNFFAVGINVFIMVILADYVVNTVKNMKIEHRLKKAFFIIGSVFVLTSGKKIATLLGVPALAFIKISTLDVFVMVFFTAAFTRGMFTKRNWGIVLSLCGLYILNVLKIGIWGEKEIGYLIRIIMMVLGLTGVFRSLNFKLKTSVAKRIVSTQTFLFSVLVISVLPLVFFIGSEGGIFAGMSLLSSFMSFGGGDAYLAIADAMFVVNGIISGDMFYGQVVPVVNAMPGSILCKTLTAVGCVFGQSTEYPVLGGAAGALTGFVAGVVGSCSVFYFVLEIYGRLEDMPFLCVLSRWIQPIIAGLLLTVAVSLLMQNIKIGTTNSLSNIYVLWVSGWIFLGCTILMKFIFFNRFVTALLAGMAAVMIL